MSSRRRATLSNLWICNYLPFKGSLLFSNNGITNEGFQFLLLQKKKQLWQFLISYLDHMKVDGMSSLWHGFVRIGDGGSLNDIGTVCH